MEETVILHTDDLHSHLENWSKIRRFLDQRKRENERKEKTTAIAVDLGGFVDRQYPLSEATNGQENILLMNGVGYDVATIGNDEGVGNSKEEPDHLYDHTEFDTILDSLFSKNTLQPSAWTKPYKIITTKHQTKIGPIAFTAPFPLTYNPNGWGIRNPYDILPELIGDLRSQVNILVLMNHLGVQDDFQIIRGIPTIDVILGSHTHHSFRGGHIINDIQVAAAGKHGRYVGEVHLIIDEEKEVLKYSVKVIPTETVIVFTEDEQGINNYLEHGHELLKEKEVADLPFSLSPDVFSEHPFIQIAFETVEEREKTETAILNNGLFLTGVPKGRVDQSQFHTASPYPMYLLNVTLGGNDLICLVLGTEKNCNFLRNYSMKGAGFCGKIFGQIVYNGITYDFINHQALWENKPVDLNKDYTFTTVDHLMFVPFSPTIEIAGKNEFLLPESIRSMVRDYLRAYYSIKQRQSIIKKIGDKRMSAKQSEQQNVEHKTEIARKKSPTEQETTVTEELATVLEEIAEEPRAEKVRDELVTLLDDSNFLIGERHYRPVSDHCEGFNAERLGERCSDVPARYDYTVRDQGYGQLRLEGFLRADNRQAHPDQRIDSLKGYPYECCDSDCAYFVTGRIGGKRKGTTRRRKKKRNHNRAYIDEKKGSVASNCKKPVIKNRETESAKTSGKVKKQEQPKQVEKTKTAFMIRKREEQ